ncbi:hypothetical protein [Rhodoplanes roseus]|uniref:Uncharacterized protein n=1 Tax=Rhodoplanes roseus TaxID=29409 RepID=A0A327L6Y3_9BRAD|nr:hypothetical protein [Rhodoplanes roseus]RAI45805.1 hypothetical protein CH341_02040 [Rhodoplanes roseus]
MSADRTPGTLAGLAVFLGSIGGLFLIARLTHVAFAVAKHPDHVSAAGWSQAGMIAAGLVLAAGIIAAARLLIVGWHRSQHHEPLRHYSGRAT